MKSKIVLLVLMSKVLVASGSWIFRKNDSKKYRMPAAAFVLEILNADNQNPNNTFCFKVINAVLADILAEQKFTEEELTNKLHDLTQFERVQSNFDPCCQGKAEALIAAIKNPLKKQDS